MKSTFNGLLMIFLVLFAFVLPVMAADAVPATASPSLLAWFQANTALILGVALAISELLAQIPAFQGNGIIDTIVKALKVLSDKPQTPAEE